MGHASKAKPFKKEDFLQANYRFVVSDGVDVKRHMVEADAMFQWEDVLQVEVSAAEAVQCPITLDSPPLVPVMTPCGHIFSLPALVHCMLATSDTHVTRATPCPLCFNTVSARDLRLVTVRYVEKPDFSGTLQFALLRRPRTSTLPRLADPSASSGARARQGTDSSRTPLAAEPFAKFLLVSDPLPMFRGAATELAAHTADVLDAGGLEAEIEGPSLFKSMDVLAGLGAAWMRRKGELAEQMGGVVGGESTSDECDAAARAVEQAIRDVFTVELADERARGVKAAETAKQSEAKDRDFPALAAGGRAPAQSMRSASENTPGLQFELDEDLPPETTTLPPQFGEEAAGVDGAPIARQELLSSSLEDSSLALLGRSPEHGMSINHITDDGDYYLYQASDGQNIFLHPINVRALLQHYKSFDACPKLLRGSIVEVEDIVQNAAVRRKLQALSHLPLTAEFKLCEIDMSQLVPQEALEPFKGELAARAAHRHKQAAKAAREAAAAAAAEESARAQPLTREELSAMPAPHEVGMTAQELAESLALQAALDAERGPSAPDVPSPQGTPPSAGPTYANLARFGLAATGPALGGDSPTQSGPGICSAAGPSRAPGGAWGAGAGAAAQPSTTGVWGASGSSAAAKAKDDEQEPPATIKRNKKGQKVLLLTGGGRS